MSSEPTAEATPAPTTEDASVTNTQPPASTVDQPSIAHSSGLPTVTLPTASGAQAAAYVWSLVRPRRGRLALVLLTGVLASLDAVAGPLVIGRLVDVLTLDPSLTPVLVGVGVLVLAAVAGALGNWWSQLWLGRLTEPVVGELRERVFDAAVEADASIVESSGRGELISRVTADSDKVTESATLVLPMFTQALTTIVVSAVGMAFVDWRLALIGLIAVPMHWFTIRWYLPRSAPLYRREREAFGVRSQRLLGGLNGVRTLRAYQQSGPELERIDAASRSARDLSNGVFHMLTRAGSRNNRAEAVVLAALLVSGFVFVWQGWITAGAVSAAALLFHRLFDPIGAVVMLFGEVQSAGASVTRMVGVITMDGRTGRSAESRAQTPSQAAGWTTDTTTTLSSEQASGAASASTAQVSEQHGTAPAGQRTNTPTAAHLPAPQALILEDVTHTYAGERPAVRNFSLRVNAGEIVAIVGPSGAGKTTVAQLATGALTPTAGQVALEAGGQTHSVRALPSTVLRRAIAMVSQEVHTFTGTVADNILLGASHRSSDHREDVLALTGALPWVASLPEGLDTVVGVGARSLNPMQEQLLALARVEAVEPAFIVLDEATAEAGSSGARVL